MTRNSHLYSSEFFDNMEQGALQSAKVIVQYLIQLLDPDSVIDIGCGRGAWLRVFLEMGVQRIRGVDGNHVGRTRLLIPNESFEQMDLNGPFKIHGAYSLAVCLEVAEHLSPSSAAHLINELTGCAPVVLFSAAIPGQGGTGHINEQWPEYWRDLFAEHSYRQLDVIRRHIMFDRCVEWWYRQNVFVYCSESFLNSNPLLNPYVCALHEPAIEWVHRSLLAGDRESTSGRELCKMLSRRLLKHVGKVR